MADDPNRPVLVGAGQISARAARGSDSVTPLGLMSEAARRALADSGAAESIGARLDSLAVPYTFSWPLEDPARLLAGELGIDPGETVRSGTGGTAPHLLLGDACSRIQAGQLETVLIAGGEAVNPFMRAIAEGRDPGFGTEPEGSSPDRMLPGDPADPGHPQELAAGLIAPISYYPLLEHAIRAAAGSGIDEHSAWLGRLWARVAEAAPENPHAWTPEVPDAAGISTPSKSNRLALHPYTKLLTANIQVDQGAALVLCSARAADELGIAAERRVHVRATAYATDHWFCGQRERLDRSPAIAACGAAALPHAGLGVDELEHLDLYSCFPAAVEIAARELGIDLETESRPLTVTGGLTFAGGPANNYCTHALATMYGRILERGGAGLATAVGWYMTKHAVAVLSAEPGRRPFAHHDVQAEVDAAPRREIAAGFEGSAPVESFTAAYSREGEPTTGFITAIAADGARVFASSAEPEIVTALLADDSVGRPAAISGSGFEI